MNVTVDEPLVLDVRPIFAAGGTPCSAIDEAIAALKPGQSFVLLVPFEPMPLYTKLGRLGYSGAPKPQADGTFRIEFTPGSEPIDIPAGPPTSCGCGH